MASIDGQSRSIPFTPERIRVAAVALFAEKGFHATGIREIAGASGISTSALYNYMAGKDDLLSKMMSDLIEATMQVAELMLARAVTPPEQLASLARGHILTQLQTPLEAAVADNEIRSLSPDARTQVLRQRDDYEDLWRRCLTAGVRDGHFVITNQTVTRVVLLEMCNGVVRWYSATGPLSPVEIADQYVGLALRMVGATHDGQLLQPEDVPTPSAADAAAVVKEIFEKRNANA